MPVQPFTLNVPDDDIAALQRRLAGTRWPDQAPGADPWAYGSSVEYMQELTEYWRESFDWRAQEAELNAFEQFRVELYDIPLHFLHVRGRGPDPLPLLLSHGWPGSVFEFIDFIPRLTDPARFGGDPADAFTVVAPSLPEYGLSFRPGQRRLGISQIAECFLELMVDVLGYERFGAQGGDWGAHIATSLGVHHGDRLRGIHLNFLPLAPDAPMPPGDPTPNEQQYLDEQRRWSREETSYAAIQGTKPQTLAFALTDSPAGLAAWIVEKMRAWSDNDGSVEVAIDRDRLLANISLHWFTGAIGSSFWPYYGEVHGDWPLASGQTVDVPVGYAAHPAEIRRSPRSHRAAQLPRHPALDRDAEGWPLRRSGAASGTSGGCRLLLPRPALIPHSERRFDVLRRRCEPAGDPDESKQRARLCGARVIESPTSAPGVPPVGHLIEKDVVGRGA